MLATCLLNNTMNFSELFELIGTVIRFLDSSFVIILNLDLFFLNLLKTL